MSAANDARQFYAAKIPGVLTASDFNVTAAGMIAGSGTINLGIGDQAMYYKSTAASTFGGTDRRRRSDCRNG